MTKYGKTDLISVAGIVLLFIALPIVFTMARNALALDARPTQIMGMAFGLAIIAAVFAVVLFKKQGLASVGIHRQNLWPALRLGLLFAPIPVIIGALLPGLASNWQLHSPGLILFLLLHTTILAFAEDVTFVGFVQTRLSGLLKSDFKAVLTGAAISSIAHIPFYLITGQVAAGFIFWFAMHCAFVAVYRKYGSLIPTTIIRASVYWAMAGLWANYEQILTARAMVWFSMLILMAAIGFWRWQFYRD